VIAGLDRSHLLADAFDYPGTLVAKHHGACLGAPGAAVDEVKVAVADAGRCGPHEQFVSDGIIEIDILYG
jgi:hypothetical protein